MAQCLHTQQGRCLPVDALQQAAPQPGPGIIRDPNGRRLYQSATASYILVTLSAIMPVCALFVTFTFKPQGLLSKLLNSIVARAGLLAGSRLLEMAPLGVEWCSDEELKKVEAFDGLALRLRWCIEGANAVRSVIIAQTSLVQHKTAIEPKPLSQVIEDPYTTPQSPTSTPGSHHHAVRLLSNWV
ncbi:uncharacterized protein Z518_09622 [Rhinocladiella mackenziei CBS 650.93]|uniref:Uncharacterized protein n=1 Tax=Rhinocladiella mackenziei CBS 650.93 TaxID=1442369 RepID=A0A0D2FEX6_9EURO|nr:uncharacterized protein Z518_09622 [Rhinocladiella mackenziei CBS 650.93]KIX00557.1 hypothetical protein Z518_09622 [Rhinocladiella mackenziei CBS 650.93]